MESGIPPGKPPLHLYLQIVAHARLLEIGAGLPVAKPDGRKGLYAGETCVAHLFQKHIHTCEPL